MWTYISNLDLFCLSVETKMNSESAPYPGMPFKQLPRTVF